MKKIYWRPRAVSRPALILISLISIAGLLVVERWKIETPQPYRAEKLAAARLASEAFAVIKAARQDVGPPIDKTIDPTESGLIGVPMSPVTTVLGDVNAKQTSINPNFAAVVVELLKEAGVQEGDVVAVGMSGSFPALNICTYAACETLGVKPLVISGASASQWGANVPALLWPDMERKLSQKRVVPANDEVPAAAIVATPEGEEAPAQKEVELPPLMNIKSIACSIGGTQDRGLGLNEDGLKLVIGSISRNGIPQFRVEQAKAGTAGWTQEDLEKDFLANIDERMKLYADAAKGQPIKAYINVGGGTVSVGKNVGKRMFKPGYNDRPPRHIRDIDGVMPRFINQRVPVIHLVHIAALANQYAMPREPEVMPPIGREGGGAVFVGIDYSKALVIGVLAFILCSLYGFIRSDIGFRIMRSSQSRKRDVQPEPMV